MATESEMKEFLSVCDGSCDHPYCWSQKGPVKMLSELLTEANAIPVINGVRIEPMATEKGTGMSESLERFRNVERCERRGPLSGEYSMFVREPDFTALLAVAEEIDRGARYTVASYGNALIEIGDLKREPMRSVMHLGISPSPAGWRNERAEAAEAKVEEQQKEIGILHLLEIKQFQRAEAAEAEIKELKRKFGVE